eukprot:16289469-Heterocapsa_arctica.AAC.1
MLATPLSEKPDTYATEKNLARRRRPRSSTSAPPHLRPCATSTRAWPASRLGRPGPLHRLPARTVENELRTTTASACPLPRLP